MAPSTGSLKFGKICRICLKQLDDMYHLFEKSPEEEVDQDVNIVEKITILAHVEVLEDDSLPNYICQSCEQQVNNCYEFRALILESDQTLRTCLASLESNSEYKIEIESDDVDLQFIDIPLEQTEDDSQETETVWVPTYNNSKVWKIRNTPEADAPAEQQIAEPPEKYKVVEAAPVVRTVVVDNDSKRTKVQRYFKCYCCEQIFHSDEERKDHMLTHLQKSQKISIDVLIKCQVCDLPFSDEYELKNHIQSHFSGQSRKTMRSRMRLENTERQNDHSYQITRTETLDPKIYKHKCPHCAKQFKTKTKMEQHEKTHTDLVYRCKLCSKVFSRSLNLNQHLLYHMRNSKFECDKCDKVFNKKTELRYHKGTHVDSPRTCDICQKSFQNLQSLKMHLKRHEMGDKYNCEYCGKRYFTNSEMARHVQTHTGERNFPCNLCEMSFMSKPELTRHLKYHGGEKKWVCNICNKKYFESGHLKVHMKSHTGEKPFVCSVCKKGFVTKCKMERHAKIHERVYEFPDVDTPAEEMTEVDEESLTEFSNEVVS